MNSRKMRQLLTFSFHSFVPFSNVQSVAEPNPLSPVTRPTEEDLKAISFLVAVVMTVFSLAIAC
jgi:hypothetical protein